MPALDAGQHGMKRRRLSDSGDADAAAQADPPQYQSNAPAAASAPRIATFRASASPVPCSPADAAHASASASASAHVAARLLAAAVQHALYAGAQLASPAAVLLRQRAREREREREARERAERERDMEAEMHAHGTAQATGGRARSAGRVPLRSCSKGKGKGKQARRKEQLLDALESLGPALREALAHVLSVAASVSAGAGHADSIAGSATSHSSSGSLHASTCSADLLLLLGPALALPRRLLLVRVLLPAGASGAEDDEDDDTDEQHRAQLDRHAAALEKKLVRFLMAADAGGAPEAPSNALPSPARASSAFASAPAASSLAHAAAPPPPEEAPPRTEPLHLSAAAGARAAGSAAAAPRPTKAHILLRADARAVQALLRAQDAGARTAAAADRSGEDAEDAAASSDARPHAHAPARKLWRLARGFNARGVEELLRFGAPSGAVADASAGGREGRARRAAAEPERDAAEDEDAHAREGPHGAPLRDLSGRMSFVPALASASAAHRAQRSQPPPTAASTAAPSRAGTGSSTASAASAASASSGASRSTTASLLELSSALRIEDAGGALTPAEVQSGEGERSRAAVEASEHAHDPHGRQHQPQAQPQPQQHQPRRAASLAAQLERKPLSLLARNRLGSGARHGGGGGGGGDDGTKGHTSASASTTAAAAARRSATAPGQLAGGRIGMGRSSGAAAGRMVIDLRGLAGAGAHGADGAERAAAEEAGHGYEEEDRLWCVYEMPIQGGVA